MSEATRRGLHGSVSRCQSRRTDSPVSAVAMTSILGFERLSRCLLTDGSFCCAAAACPGALVAIEDITHRTGGKELRERLLRGRGELKVRERLARPVACRRRVKGL